MQQSVETTLGHLRVLDAGPDTAPAPAVEAPLTLEDLYRQHRMRLVRLAILLVDEPATAEDVVQEAFTGLHRHWSGLRD
ncbi:MAG: RNA polymerase sigma factor, partial [Pseudonocardiaceae bacterium]